MNTEISIDTRTASGIGGASPPDWAKPSRSGGRHSSFQVLSLAGQPIGLSARNVIREVEPGVFSVELTQGKVALVDRADLELVAAHRWYANRFCRTFYATTNIRRDNGCRTTFRMQRLSFPVAEEVDHINGNGLDNRRANLRAATRAENQCNCRTPITNTSGLKGAYWDKTNSRWVSYITVKGLQIYLGRHDTAEECARAYDAAARVHFGAFACVNFPAEGEQGTAR
jgi:hypothetical protein